VNPVHLNEMSCGQFSWSFFFIVDRNYERRRSIRRQPATVFRRNDN